MNEALFQIQNCIKQMAKNAQCDITALFPGITLVYLSFETAPFSMRHAHSAMGNVLQINYCKCGQMEWRMRGGQSIYLNPGSYSLHVMDACADSSVSFPTGQYSGLIVCLDLEEAALRPPEPFQDTDLFTKTLPERFCHRDTPFFLAGNEQAERIFSAFYGQPEPLRLPYQRVKALELLLYLAKLPITPQRQLTAYRKEQVETIRKIHDRLSSQTCSGRPI